MVTPRIILFVTLVAFSFPAEAAKKRKKRAPKKPPTINLDAEVLSKAIPKYNPQENKGTAEEQMKQLIHLIAKTNRDNLSSNTSLVRTAMDFRGDLGEHQRTTSMGAIVKAWDTAFSYGAINNHQFTGHITTGRYEGEQLVFENIVPPNTLKECKGYIGNLRLVPESVARKSGASPTSSERAYATGLRQIMHESGTHATMLDMEKSKIGHLGMSKAEHEARWQRQVAETGDAYKKRPNLRLVAQKMGTPSKLNGNRYSLRVDITNQSPHPTEVEIISTIVGYTDNGNKLYEMRRDIRFLKLRSSQVDVYTIKTPNVSVFQGPLKGYDTGKSQRVMYRGYTVVAKFDGEIIDQIGSDARLLRVAMGEYAPPRVITNTSRAGGPKGPKRYDLIRYKTPKDLAAGKNGTKISDGMSSTVGLMADDSRLYRLDADGALWIFEAASFNSTSEPLGKTFAGARVHSLFCDGPNFYLHLSQPAGGYSADDVVKFPTVMDLMSGQNGKVIGKAAAGSAAFMANGESFFKIHHGNVQQTLFSSKNLGQLMANKNFKNEGKLFCGTNHSGAFSDGTYYYLQAPATPK